MVIIYLVEELYCKEIISKKIKVKEGFFKHLILKENYLLVLLKYISINFKIKFPKNVRYKGKS